MRALFGSPGLYIRTLAVLFTVPLLTAALIVSLQVRQHHLDHQVSVTQSANVLARTLSGIPESQRATWLAQLTGETDALLGVLAVRLTNADGSVVVDTGVESSANRVVGNAITPGGARLTIVMPASTTRTYWVRGAVIALLVTLAAVVAYGIAIWPTVKSIIRSLEDATRTIDTYRQSNFSARVAEQGPGRFGKLETALNRMGEALAGAAERARTDARSANDDLQLTLEEVEIKNVELDLARQRAERDARDKSRFLANMSHEIRTPMNSVVGYTQLLTATDLDDVQHSYVNRIDRSASTLLDIIDDILSLSRLEAGKLALASDEFDIRRIAEQAVEMLAPAAYRKSLRLHTLIDPNVPTCLVGDGPRLRQILVNFLSNAIKFTDEGRVELCISAQRQTDRNTVLSLKVRDTGRGISRHDRQKLFEPFTETSRREQGGGAGLGLTIARALTQAMGGQLSLSSTPGEGSAFIARFPLKTNYSLAFDFLAVLEGLTVDVAVEDAVLREHLVDHCRAVGITVNSRTSWPPPNDAPGSQTQFVLLDTDDPEALGDTWRDDWPTPIVLVATSDSALLHRFAARSKGTAIARHTHATGVLALMARYQGVEAPDFLTDTPEPALPDVRGARVLVADDDRLSRLYLQALLQQHGVNVSACADGAQAVTLAKNLIFDAIFLDMRMPECDGETATQQIRAESANETTPVFILTASAMPEERRRLEAAGINDCLIKPAPIAQLLNAVKTGRSTPANEAPDDTHPTTVGISPFTNGALRDELSRYRSELIEDLPDSTPDDTAELAHRLRGAAAVSGLTMVADRAADFEAAARARHAEAMSLARDELGRALDQAIRGLEH